MKTGCDKIKESLEKFIKSSVTSKDLSESLFQDLVLKIAQFAIIQISNYIPEERYQIAKSFIEELFPDEDEKIQLDLIRFIRAFMMHGEYLALERRKEAISKINEHWK